MNWIDELGNAIGYIEENLTEKSVIEDVAKHIYISEFYFQKAFSMLCGFPAGEYVRRRRLTLAGSEIVSTDRKIIDIALKYGYDSPDSFTKAFTRFHGATPTAVRRDSAMLKSFAPLKLKFTLEGGNIMDYRIIKKEAFTVVGKSRLFSFDSAFGEIPKFWDEVHAQENNTVCGMFGVCLDNCGESGKFEYIIADNYLPWEDIKEGCKAVTIPSLTWAVFPVKGPMPTALQAVNRKIFSEWLPNCKDYEVSENCNIELYSPADRFENGISDENYYTEIWIPVKEKSR